MERYVILETPDTEWDNVGQSMTINVFLYVKSVGILWNQVFNHISDRICDWQRMEINYSIL